MFIELAASLALAATTPSAAFATYGDERLGGLIDEALRNNPRVLQAFAEYQAARHRMPQATALPDPTISFTQFARSVETRVGSQQRLLALSQRFPGVGKRAAGGQLASKAAAVSDELYRAVQAEIVLGVKHAYYELGYLDRALAASQEDESLLGHFEEIARRRYAQGLGLQGDALRLQALITRAIHNRQQLLSRRVELEASLNALRHAPSDTPIAEVRLDELPALELERESLASIGSQYRPEVKAALLRVEESEKAVHLARIRHRPDVSFGLSWGNIRARGTPLDGIRIPSDGKDSYGISVGLSLPLFRSKYDAGVREAAERLAAARFAYRDSAAELESEIRSISFRIKTIQGQLDLLERALVPQSEQALRSTEAAYSNGTIEVTGLLDMRRILLDVQLGLARLRADFLKAVADLERAIGSAVPEEAQS